MIQYIITEQLVRFTNHGIHGMALSDEVLECNSLNTAMKYINQIKHIKWCDLIPNTEYTAYTVYMVDDNELKMVKEIFISV